MAQPNEQAYNVIVFSAAPSVDHDRLRASITQSVAATRIAFHEDVACAYDGGRVKEHVSYRQLVEHCLSIDEAGVRSFWARFRGQPVAFPATITTSFAGKRSAR